MSSVSCRDVLKTTVSFQVLQTASHNTEKKKKGLLTQYLCFLAITMTFTVKETGLSAVAMSHDRKCIKFPALHDVLCVGKS